MKTSTTLSLFKLNDFFKRGLLYLSLFLLPGFVAGQDFNWVSQLSDGANLSVNSTIVDGSGNTYSVGFFSSTADFDPGPGTFNLTSGGGTDAFVLKLDANGNLVWAFHMPGASSGSATDIAFDAAGNIIVVGAYQNATDFDPSGSTFNLTWGSGACFVAKYNPSGNFIWAGDFRTGGGVSANSVATDASNNVYVAGGFSETPDFDPGPGTANLTNVGGAFSGDGYICKLNSAGAFVWVRQLASSDDARCQGIAVDASGVYATGSFAQTCDFDPTGTVANLTSAGASDAFVLKWDQNGNYIWAKRIGSTAGEGGSDLTLDGSGNVITIGGFSGTVDFDPGAGVQNASSNGLGDIFIQKLDATGNFVWTRTFGGADNDAGFAITVDNVNNIYSTGYFNQTVDLDPTAGVQNATALGSYDMYVQKLDASGNFVWAQAMGGSAGDYGRGIAAAVDNIVYVGGFFNNTVDFDPSAGVNNLTSAGGLDGFVLNLSPSPEIAVSGNGLNITDGQTATSTADFTDFGSICTANPLTYSFTIENTLLGTTLNISSITSSDPSFVVSNQPLAGINGGNSATFDLTYTPTATGTNNATITINNNDLDEGVFTFNVTGTATASPNDFAVSAASTAFCAAGSSTTVDIASSEIGVNYYLRDDATNTVIAGPIAGTGGALSFPTGTINTTTTYNVYAEVVSAGSALNFNSNQYINSNGLATFSNNFTIEAWVNPTSTHQIDVPSISGALGTSGQKYMLWPTHRGGEAGVGLSIGTNGVSVYEHGSGYMPSLLSWSGTISGWTHVAVVYINKQPRLYINGTLVQTGLTSSKSNCYPSLGRANVSYPNVGGIGGGSYGYFDGSIDDFRIWSVSRTATEIQNNMNSCLNGTEPNLFALYDFEDGTGSSVLTDLTGANNGTLTNMDPATDWVTGSATCGAGCSLEMTDKVTITIGGNFLGSDVRGNMYTFDGAGHYIELPDIDLSASDQMTIEAWVKPIDITTNTYYEIIRQEGPSAGNYDWFISFQNNGTNLTFRVRNAGGTSATLNYGITAANFENQWNHIAGVYDGANLHLYINGEKVGPTVALSGNVRNSGSGNTALGSFKVGASVSEYFEGSMDEVRIWSTTRTQSEIRENMHLSLTDCSSGLLAYYQFDTDDAPGTPNGVKDALGVFNGTTVGGIITTASEVPVGGGSSDRLTVNTAGTVLFPATNISMTFGATNPNGEVVVSRIRTERPTGWASIGAGSDVDNEYFVVRNYGTNNSFTVLTDVTFNDIGYIDPTDAATPAVFNLYKRASNAFGNTWGTSIGTAVSATDGNLGSVGFDNSTNINSFSQFVIVTAAAQLSDLPIELMAFNANRTSNDQVLLDWQTASELNNKGFYIERMLENETEFMPIGWIDGFGTTSEITHYEYNDENAYTGVSYYRLRQVDFDGTESFSDVRAVSGSDLNIFSDVNIYPVPVRDELTVSFGELPKGVLSGQVRIVDMQGRVIYDASVAVQSHQTLLIEEVADWTSGMYLLQIQLDNGSSMLEKFVKQ
jgi:hypothetical protein